VAHPHINSAFAIVGASVTTFGATNVDDLLLLSLFFAKRQPMRRVLVGQYLGFAGIVALSLLGWWASLAIPLGWFRVLGLLPLAIGIIRLVHLRGPESQPGNAFNIFSIASITFANGADNVGVYVPFFAVSSEYVLWILACYGVLLPIWCFVGRWLGERPVILRAVDRHGHWIVPLVFTSLGLYILLKR
jgi:cadmium resistance protein CadD (predicted permease)